MAALSTSINAGCWDLDLATGALKLCPVSRKMFGFDPHSTDVIIEQQWLERLHPDDWASAREAMRACMVSSRPYAERFRTILPDGSARLVLGIGRPLGGDGDRAHFGGWNFDIAAIGEFAATWLSEHPDALESEHFVAVRTPPAIEAMPQSQPVRFDPLQFRARAILRVRRCGEQLLGKAIVDGPALDLLLHLYVTDEPADLDDLKDTVEDLPSTTASRWISHLSEERLIDLTVSVQGSKLVRLSARGRDRLEEFLSRR